MTMTDTYMDDKGRELWADGNSQGKRAHSLAKRPAGAAPLFTEERAIELSHQRWEERRLAAERGYVEAVAEEWGVSPDSLSFEDAYEAIHKAQGKKALKGFTAAAKLAMVATGSVEPTRSPAIVNDGPRVGIVQLIFASPEAVEDYIDQQIAAGNGQNAAFVEAQFKEINQEGPIELGVLWRNAYGQD